MKKSTLIILVIAIALVGSYSCYAQTIPVEFKSADSSSAVFVHGTFTIDGNTVDFPEEIYPYYALGTDKPIYVPVYWFVTYFDCRADWNSKTGYVTISSGTGDYSFSVKAGTKEIIKDGLSWTMPYETVEKKDRVYMPINILAGELGYKVENNGISFTLDKKRLWPK